jgi:hypothetical protein
VLLPIVYIGNEFDPPKDNSLIFAIERIKTKNFKLLSVLLGQFSVKQKEVMQIIWHGSGQCCGSRRILTGTDISES